MKPNRKLLLLGAGLVAVLVVVGLVGIFYSGPVRYDADFYAAGAADAQGLARALSKHVDARGLVHYAGLKADRADLDAYCRAIARTDPERLARRGRKQRIAFWINAYNALTLKAIIDHYPIRAGALRSLRFPADSIRQIPGVWDKLQFLVAGRKMTLNQIEHEVLRRKFREPRIHVALVCAARGCPPLRNEPYDGARLDAQLADQARRFFADPARFRIDRAAGRVYLSSIFKWYGEDFVARYAPAEGFAGHEQPLRASLNFAARHLPKADAEYLAGGKYRVSYLDYDWSLNERKTPPAPATAPASAPAR